MHTRQSPVTKPKASLGLLLVLCSASLEAEVAGRITSDDGLAIANAQVVAPSGAVRFTDLDGGFNFPDVEAPAELVVSHPRFLEARVEVAESPALIALEAKQEIFHDIVVSVAPGDTGYTPSSSSASVIDVSRLATPPSTLTDIVATAPGVAENGQGGIFQTYSIRGVARQRVLTLISGMRIVGERRAGVSAAFLDPGLIGKVDVVRGPSSTYYGSGALGGVIQLFPREFEGTTVEVGYETNGEGSRQLVGWGNDGWSLGLAHRTSGRGETADGEILNDEYDQASSVLTRSWKRGAIDYSVLALASQGVDIGKSNVDFPERVTFYPEENHAVVRFAMRSDKGWGFDAWAHPNDLETRVERDGLLTTTLNEAIDSGFNFHGRRRWDEHTSLRFGMDYFGRRKVEAWESIRPIDGRGRPEVVQKPLDGSEDELGLYSAFERNWGGTVLLVGGRFAAQRQSAADAESRDQTALSGFAGLVVPLRPGLELAANLGTGLRFASLSERFFSGVTPRGSIIANPDLDPERARSIDLALRYYGSRLFLSAGAFGTQVRDYIERIELAADELTFVNLTRGELTGFELEGAYRLSSQLSLAFGGHALAGRGDDDVPLADVPADQVFVRASWRRGRWSVAQRWEHRFEKSDPGNGENAIGAADLVSAVLALELTDGFTLGVSGRNLLDESYFATADDKAELARGRSLGLTLTWRG